MHSHSPKRNYFSSTGRLKSLFPESEVFRKFLPNENLYENSKEKNIQTSKTDLMPEYFNITKKINKNLKTVKNFFNYEKYYFKEKKQQKIAETYSSFRKGFSLYLFGPNGKIPASELIRILKENEKRYHFKEKIYAGALDLYTNLDKYNSYSERVKSNFRKKIEISDNFETIKNINGKIHSLYLKSKNSKEPILKSGKNNNIFLTTMQNPKTEENRSSSYKTYTKKFYKPFIKKSNKTKKNVFNRNLLLLTKSKRYEPPKLKKGKLYSRSKSTITKILKNKEKFKKDIYAKINATESPSLILTKNLNNFFIANSRIHLKKEDKFREDIRVIGRDDKKEYFSHFNMTDVRQKLVLDPKDLENKQCAPAKIYYSYYDSDENRKSILDLVREMGKIREEEKEKKYMKNIRHHFFDNWNKISKLGFELDDIKKNCKIYKNK